MYKQVSKIEITMHLYSHHFPLMFVNKLIIEMRKIKMDWQNAICNSVLHSFCFTMIYIFFKAEVKNLVKKSM